MSVPYFSTKQQQQHLQTQQQQHRDGGRRVKEEEGGGGGGGGGGGRKEEVHRTLSHRLPMVTRFGRKGGLVWCGTRSHTTHTHTHYTHTHTNARARVHTAAGPGTSATNTAPQHSFYLSRFWLFRCLGPLIFFLLFLLLLLLHRLGSCTCPVGRRTLRRRRPVVVGRRRGPVHESLADASLVKHRLSEGPLSSFSLIISYIDWRPNLAPAVVLLSLSFSLSNWPMSFFQG